MIRCFKLCMHLGSRSNDGAFQIGLGNVVGRM